MSAETSKFLRSRCCERHPRRRSDSGRLEDDLDPASFPASRPGPLETLQGCLIHVQEEQKKPMREIRASSRRRGWNLRGDCPFPRNERGWIDEPEGLGEVNPRQSPREVQSDRLSTGKDDHTMTRHSQTTRHEGGPGTGSCFQHVDLRSCMTLYGCEVVSKDVSGFPVRASSVGITRRIPWNEKKDVSIYRDNRGGFTDVPQTKFHNGILLMFHVLSFTCSSYM